MGFRSQLISGSYMGIELPFWFLKKYEGELNIRHGRLSISTPSERKFYSGKQTELFLDIQKVLIEKEVTNVELVLLHECGGITRVEIHQDKILFSEPTGWKVVENIEHKYCYGCSDARKWMD